jgi:hypothetical protein
MQPLDGFRDVLDLKSPEYVAEIQRRERADDERAYASKPDYICGIHHETDEEATAASTLDAMSGVKSQSDGPLWPASNKQIAYVLGLQDERRLPDDWTIRGQGDLEKMERDEVSSLITMLKAFPRGDAKQHQWSMPPGRYALLIDPEPWGGSTGGADATEWQFFEISKPDVGRWKGYTFIKRLVGAPGNYRKVDMPVGDRNRILAMINNDPKRASTNYGLQAKRCGICFSPLTNPDSLKAGIGPICRSKVGW